MSFLLDNLTAVVVAAVLIGAMFVLQQRTQQDAVEAVQRNQTQAQASGLATTIEREVENARSRPDAERAFAVDPALPSYGTETYRFSLRQATASDGTVYTSQLAFPTLSSPDDAGASGLHMTVYHVEETSETARVDGRDRPLLTATRYEFRRGGPLRETATYTRLVDFDVTAFEADGTQATSAPSLAETPVRVHLELRFAPAVSGRQASDQDKAEVTSTRHARTVRVVGAQVGAGNSPVDPTAAGGLPSFPGDPGHDPSTPPTTEPGSDPDARVSACHDGKIKSIKQKELAQHLGHGDTLGACP